jgi:hypothetical protein
VKARAASLRLAIGAAVLVFAACGDRTSLLGVTALGAATSPDGGASDRTDAGIDAPGQGACVGITLAPTDLTCVADSDCAYVSSGEVCDTCCPSTAANEAASQRIEAALASLPASVCAPCTVPGGLECIAGQCAVCKDPGGCGGRPDGSDAGEFVDDGGAAGGDEGGVAQCVIVNLALFSQSCNTASDCVEIIPDSVCDGECACNESAAINASDLPRYEQIVAGIRVTKCPCNPDPHAECVNGACISCGGFHPAPQCPP